MSVVALISRLYVRVRQRGECDDVCGGGVKGKKTFLPLAPYGPPPAVSRTTPHIPGFIRRGNRVVYFAKVTSPVSPASSAAARLKRGKRLVMIYGPNFIPFLVFFFFFFFCCFLSSRIALVQLTHSPPPCNLCSFHASPNILYADPTAEHRVCDIRLFTRTLHIVRVCIIMIIITLSSSCNVHGRSRIILRP